MALTVDNPDVAARLRALARALGKTTDQVLADMLDATLIDAPPSAEDVAAIRAGLEQCDRGEGVEGTDYLAHLRRREGLPPRATGFTRPDAA